MNTIAGKKMAEYRQKIMEYFLDEFMIKTYNDFGKE